MAENRNFRICGKYGRLICVISRFQAHTCGLYPQMRPFFKSKYVTPFIIPHSRVNSRCYATFLEVSVLVTVRVYLRNKDHSRLLGCQSLPCDRGFRQARAAPSHRGSQVVPCHLAVQPIHCMVSNLFNDIILILNEENAQLVLHFQSVRGDVKKW